MLDAPLNDVRRALAAARALGFLGPGPVEDHLDHSVRFLTALGHLEGPALDLGAGGGVPGLVLAAADPGVAWVLLDANARRTTFLASTVASLGWSDRVEVRTMRAEEAGRHPDLRGTFATAVARSFGPPAVVAECAAPLLRVGGRLAVSEPPDGAPRWPEDGLRLLGLQAAASGDRGIWVGEQVVPTPERYPRRVGIPAKRPLF